MGAAARVVNGTSLTVALRRAHEEVSARVTELVEAEELSLEQWLTLDQLAVHGPSTMSELAGYTSVTTSTLTRVVDRLASVAVVYREVDSVDRRRVRVLLSGRGRDVHARLRTEIDRIENAMLDGLDVPSLLGSLELIAGHRRTWVVSP